MAMNLQEYGTVTESTWTPARVADVWHRRKWTAMAVAAAALAAVTVATLSLPDLYRASASVLVQRECPKSS
jgi:uncharacterized protein involved in exopolysaccharide biosynthesis